MHPATLVTVTLEYGEVTDDASLSLHALMQFNNKSGEQQVGVREQNGRGRQ